MIVSAAGPNTLHACFMVCLKVDLYQPKYANIPMSYSVTPCPAGQAFVDGYGVGTVFTATNLFGGREEVKVVEVEPLAKIVSVCGPVQMTYTTKQLPNGDCELGYAMDGPDMGLFARQTEMQLNTLKAFIEANVAAICNEDPPGAGICRGNDASPLGGEATGHKSAIPSVPIETATAPKLGAQMTIEDVCNWAAAQGLDTEPFRQSRIDGKLLLQMDHEMLEEVGVTSKIERTKLLNAIADLGSSAPTGQSFVEVQQHAQAQQAQQAMFQFSQTEAIMRQAQLNHHASRHH